MRNTLMIFALHFAACAVDHQAPPSTVNDKSSRTDGSSFCPVDDECQAIPVKTYGDAWINANYSDTNQDEDWDCYHDVYSWSCVKEVYRADYTRLRVHCWVNEHNCPPPNQSKTCTETACQVIAYITRADAPAAQLSEPAPGKPIEMFQQDSGR